MLPFHNVPTEVAAFGDEVYFLPVILSNVSDKQPFAQFVERNRQGLRNP